MVEKILGALAALDIHIYSIHECRSRSVEAFFIRRKLDLKRGTTLADYTVTVCRPLEKDGQALLGSASVPLYPGMEEEELKASLRSAYHAASLAGNPFYELYAGKKEAFVPSASGLAGRPLEENLKIMTEALFAPDVRDDVFLNSAEIFSTQEIHRVVNSSGADVSWETYGVNGEYVVQCISPADVETYRSFSYREPDAAALRADVENALAQTLDRAAAQEPPMAGTYDVILSGDAMQELFSYYMDRSNASMVYQNYSTWKAGQAVQGDPVQGDAITVLLKAAEPYDLEGIPLIDRPLIENGVLKTLQGGARFSYYLGVQPTGNYHSIQVPTGSAALSEMKSRPYLHVVSFSDFQMDALSGHFGGEIRLAYLYDGRTVKNVTGGSINGSFLEAQEHMVFSRERYRSADYDGPFAVAIQGVAVAGKGEA